MPSLVVTIDRLKNILRKPRKSTPFRHLIEYCMIEWLHDTELQWVVVFFLQSVCTGVPLRALVDGDFYAVPAKVPHGPIVNVRPLLNFTTRRQLVRAHVAHQYVPLLARAGVPACTDAEPGTPRPPNHVFCTDSRRQLIYALIAKRPALAAILFHYVITGPLSRSQMTASPLPRLQ